MRRGQGSLEVADRRDRDALLEGLDYLRQIEWWTDLQEGRP